MQSGNPNQSLEVLDTVHLNFSPEGLFWLNITLAIIMFGVALELKTERFREIIKHPRSIMIGILSQFLVLPAFTLGLIWILNPIPSVAYGMILVAACPGGNISNFITAHAKGNTELSVSLTAISDLSAIFMTPFNFLFWGKLYAQLISVKQDLVIPIEIDSFEMFETVFILLGIPLALGMWISRKYPEITAKIKKPIKIGSIVVFFGYVVAALLGNISFFKEYIYLIIGIVILHNALALSTGFSIAWLFRESSENIRTITIETGIQNSGLALVLIFNPDLFNGLGGMASIAALWGLWHIVAGLVISTIWSRFPVRKRAVLVE